MIDQLAIQGDAPLRKPIGRMIGYARVDTMAEKAALTGWVRQLRACGAIKVFTDVGRMPDALEGLRAAISCLRVNDAVIYPEICLRDLTVGRIPAVFNGIPDGTALMFFEPMPRTDQCGDELMSIRLQDRD
ncbi:hypothetical protein JQX09_19485 [Sulfitobacter pseudonitzschiae]|uniref:Uncharacterized protein n=1 Tax=Pseudosulfitobacter pseudonitzschiae TaxID=1402135 RepID=A0A9Q2NL93_9RHOB|nr:hypothetical protein [Pseudosulfitobacter pseudonitzschiae]MBM2294114.1 hypothetical protein [Pseudosulfitobacter pseudonitzschiae]MBM2299038.1 hypothetical protein [Pseudosulfitobacter pseudonitzschiae]MBM2303946.1 hypothetical protein [Pseudosulfitobacter pseudonitzschiae]MBM2313727.1 hypothetical protein [Pseudosulfitobacter pseudonitzschiae]MBM2318642.1 hypothetical protein [Pseudosulfitobacter pseudonitzschiae]